MFSLLIHLLMVLRIHCFALKCQKIGKIKDVCLHYFKNCGYIIHFIAATVQINSFFHIYFKPATINVQFTAQCDKDLQFIYLTG